MVQRIYGSGDMHASPVGRGGFFGPSVELRAARWTRMGASERGPSELVGSGVRLSRGSGLTLIVVLQETQAIQARRTNTAGLARAKDGRILKGTPGTGKVARSRACERSGTADLPD